MDGIGSGRHWYYGTKDATSDYRSIDVRRWERDGLLTPHQAFGWQWSRDGEVVHPSRYAPNQTGLCSSIATGATAKNGRMKTTRCIWIGRPATSAGTDTGSFALLAVAGGV